MNESVKKVIHIGAHTGEEAESYFLNGVTDVIWVEANDSLVEELNQHVSKYDIISQILNIALWDKCENMTFKVTNNFQSSSFYDLDLHSIYYPNISVIEHKNLVARRLDSIDYLNFYDFDFINIDTQGAELSILKGMGELLLNPSIKGIYLEVNNKSLYKDIPLVDEIDQFIANYGFIRVLTEWTNEGWGDALYIKSKLPS